MSYKSYNNIKVQTITLNRLKKIKKMYGFQNLSDTIQMLIGKLGVETLLTAEEKKWLSLTNDLLQDPNKEVKNED